MRRVSERVKKLVILRPNICAFKNHLCDGRITWEHAVIYAGRQIDEAWAIVKICEYHHSVNKYQDGGALDKQKNVWVALNQATDVELKKYSKVVDYVTMRKKLNEKYGPYIPPSTREN